jgi:hypothetical protein
MDHASLVLLKGSGDSARCGRVGFQLADDDIDAFEKQLTAHVIKIVRKKDPEPSITDMVTFENPKGTVMELFKRGSRNSPRRASFRTGSAA